MASADDIYARATRSPVYAGSTRNPAGEEHSNLYRFVDGTWQWLPSTEEPEGTWQHAEDPPPEGAFTADLPLIGIGPDGTLWGVEVHGPEPASRDLVRFDGGEWHRWPLGGTESTSYREGSTIGVAPDASVWVGLSANTRSCAGIGHFDGVTWHRYLTDSCIESLDIAADGSVWVLADKVVGTGITDAYVITPEAVAAGT